MQQQAPQTMNQAHPMAINVVSTEQIQKYLDENKNLIVAILENQNMGKIAECAQYQAILQKNLMYLAAIADAQPPGSGLPSQLPSSSAATQGTATGQQSHNPTVQQQQPIAPVAKSPFQLDASSSSSKLRVSTTCNCLCNQGLLQVPWAFKEANQVHSRVVLGITKGTLVSEMQREDSDIHRLACFCFHI